MTIQELGSLGELVAALATIATLVYLATQIRNSTKATRTTNFLDVYGQMGTFTRMCAQNPELADLYRRACESYFALDPEERPRAHMMLCSQLLPNSVMLQLRRDEMIDPEVSLGATDTILGKLFAMKGVREWWSEEGRWFPEDFQGHVAAMIEADRVEMRAPGSPPPA